MPLVEGYTQGGEACRTARRHCYNSGTPLLTGMHGLVRSCRCGVLVAKGYPAGPARDSTRHLLQRSTTSFDRGVRTGWQQQERPTGGRWVRKTQGLGEWSAFQDRMRGSGRSSAGYPSAGQEGMQGTNSGYMQPPIPHYQEGEPMEAEEDWEDGYVEAASLFRQPV